MSEELIPETKGKGGFILFDNEEQRVNLINLYNDSYNRYLKHKRKLKIIEANLRMADEVVGIWSEYPPHDMEEAAEFASLSARVAQIQNDFYYFTDLVDKDLTTCNHLEPLIKQINYEVE
jgi:hypothetical protein